MEMPLDHAAHLALVFNHEDAQTHTQTPARLPLKMEGSATETMNVMNASRRPRAGTASLRTMGRDSSDEPSEPPLMKETMVAIEAAQLSRALHDIRSPLTVLVCNRRFLSELLARAGIEDAELVEIMEDDGAALARLQEAVETFNMLARGSR